MYLGADKNCKAACSHIDGSYVCTDFADVDNTVYGYFYSK